MTRALATSPDGQWAALRDGRELVMLAGAAPPELARAELASEDVDIALVGPPNALVVIERGTPPSSDSMTRGTRGDARARVALYEPPSLDVAARLELDTPARLAAITGTRLVLVAPGVHQVAIVRAAGRALAHQMIDVGSPVELAVGLEKSQVLFALHKRIEVWDAVSGRPMLRPQFPLPPAPRALGAAAGHLWAIQPGRDEIFVYRLSDGRPFRHHVGAAVEDVVCHPASPVLVLVTPRGLVRLHCYAHSLTLVDDAPWQPGTPLAQLVTGDDIALVGVAAGSRAPWRVALGTTGAAVAAPAPAAGNDEPAAAPLVTAADKLRALRASRDHADVPRDAPRAAPVASQATASWRDALAAYGHELVRGAGSSDAAAASLPNDGELGELAHRLALPPAARRALAALYAVHLVGEPALAIARLARAIGDWNEALGRGELASLAMLERERGKVALAAAVTDALDGAPPRAVRLVG
ncbi:MAG TPA: hypothetical protein VMJ10_19930, partial [Kofleriaceae bacterium]|nr:hypothetical protein [Kofleriaceae bacterium]